MKQKIIAELERRIAECRKGAGTYPDLDNVADFLEDFLRWVKALK